MIEYLSKTRFINALVKEHLAIEEDRKLHESGTQKQYLRLEILPPAKPGEHATLVIRGNRLGQLWLVLNAGANSSNAGLVRLHKMAVDIAFSAATKISGKLGGIRVEIGMPAVEG